MKGGGGRKGVTGCGRRQRVLGGEVQRVNIAVGGGELGVATRKFQMSWKQEKGSQDTVGDDSS